MSHKRTSHHSLKPKHRFSRLIALKHPASRRASTERSFVASGTVTANEWPADQNGGYTRTSADQRLLPTVTRIPARRRADRRLCARHRPSGRGHWHAQMRHFGAFPGWPTAVRMIAVGYRYLSPVPGMSVEVRVPAEGICGDRQGKGADGFVGQAGIRGRSPPAGRRFPAFHR